MLYNVLRAQNRLNSFRFYQFPASASNLSRNREFRKEKEESLYQELSATALRNVMYEETKRPSFLALDYFDHLYEERFGSSVWGSIRCSLLSPRKHVAFVTQQSDELNEAMKSINGFDVLKNFRARADLLADTNFEKLEKMKISLFGNEDVDLDALYSNDLGISYS